MIDMPTVYVCDRPTARKEHKCCECGGKIPIGEKYHKHHGIWDGSAYTFKVCNDCEELRKDVDADITDPEEKTAFEQLYDSVFNSHDLPMVKRFMDIKRKRGAEIRSWMAEREAELSNAKQ